MLSNAKVSLAVLGFTAVAAFAAAPQLTIRHPKNGAVFNNGQTQTYVMGSVSPPSAEVTCNGEPVAVHPKTGGFVFMRQLQPGANRIEMKSGEATTVCTVVRQPPEQKPANAIAPYTLREPTGVLTGETVRLVCLTLPKHQLYAKVGKKSIKLSESTDNPGTYTATQTWAKATDKPLPVTYYGKGLQTANGGTLEVKAEWPNCEIRGPRYEVRLRSLPGDGDTIGFPESGLVLRTTGYCG